MCELGEYIRKIEWEINTRVENTKQLALSVIKIEYEKGGTLK